MGSRLQRDSGGWCPLARWEPTFWTQAAEEPSTMLLLAEKSCGPGVRDEAPESQASRANLLRSRQSARWSPR